ncbi:MAG TPA: hypothetical protein DCM08_08780 [Microscillaceae bacterium]|nr:hypothetical protein [Microscillaceae bacterium]
MNNASIGRRFRKAPYDLSFCKRPACLVHLHKNCGQKIYDQRPKQALFCNIHGGKLDRRIHSGYLQTDRDRVVLGLMQQKDQVWGN